MRLQVDQRVAHGFGRRHKARHRSAEHLDQHGFAGRQQLERVVGIVQHHGHIGLHAPLEDGARGEQRHGSLREHAEDLPELTHIFTIKLRDGLHFAQAHAFQQRLQQLALQHFALLTAVRRSAWGGGVIDRGAAPPPPPPPPPPPLRCLSAAARNGLRRWHGEARVIRPRGLFFSTRFFLRLRGEQRRIGQHVLFLLGFRHWRRLFGNNVIRMGQWRAAHQSERVVITRGWRAGLTAKQGQRIELIRRLVFWLHGAILARRHQR